MLPIYVLEKDNSHPGDVTREQINLTFGGRAIQTTDPADIPWHDLAGSAALYVFEKENSIIQPDGSVWNWITPEREQALWNYINEGAMCSSCTTAWWVSRWIPCGIRWPADCLCAIRSFSPCAMRPCPRFIPSWRA